MSPFYRFTFDSMGKYSPGCGFDHWLDVEARMQGRKLIEESTDVPSQYLPLDPWGPGNVHIGVEEGW